MRTTPSVITKSASNGAIKSVSGSDTTRLPPIAPVTGTTQAGPSVTTTSAGSEANEDNQVSRDGWSDRHRACFAGNEDHNETLSSQISRRTTARSEASSTSGKPRSRTQSATRSAKPIVEWQN